MPLRLRCGALTLGAAGLLAGCETDPRAVQPSDFARADAPTASEPAAGSGPLAAPEPPPSEAALPERSDDDTASATQAAPAGAESFAGSNAGDRSLARSETRVEPSGPMVLDALVGQINGLPVFADDLLADLDAQLAALGRRLEPATFRTRAAELIDGSLRERLVNALILGEAERSLTDNQQAGVRLAVAERREELLRRHGRGSLAMARKALLEDTGLSLDETLRQFRDGIITNSYIRQNLNARINVSRREVERFYRDNIETFQPPATRDLDLLWVDDASLASAVEARLAAGEPFDQVAADPAVANAWAGGRMTTIVGDEPFSRPAVDAAVAGLREAGDWAGPIAQPGPDGSPGDVGDVGDVDDVDDVDNAGTQRFWFVYGARVEAPEGRDLLAAQAEIELTLRERQFLRLRQRFVDRLLREGSHTPIEEMAEAVLRIAINRYSRPEA